MRPLNLYFLLFPFLIFAQWDDPFPDSAAIWVQTAVAPPDPLGSPYDPTIISPYIFATYQTQIINGLEYHVITEEVDPIYIPFFLGFDSNDFFGYYRVDGDKVYFLHEPTFSFSYSPTTSFLGDYGFDNFNTTNEYLLYDFGLEVGDTFNLTNAYKIVVQSIDSVEINGFYYDRINFYDQSFSCCEGIYDYWWVKGIGSSHGFFPFAPTFESWVEFNCFHEYSGYFEFDTWDPFGYCALSHLGVDENNESLYSYPNPVIDKITIDLPNPDVEFTIEIHSILGGLISKSNAETTIDISNLTPGMYILSLHQNGEIRTKRIEKL